MLATLSMAGLLAMLALPIAPAGAQSDTTGAAVAASVKAPGLPPEYAPSDKPPRYNSNQPPFVKDVEEMHRLRSQGPQWIQQLMLFPPETELMHNLGQDSGGSRERAAEAVRQVINPRMLPSDFPLHLIPLSRWAVLYDDWRKQGGTDVFLTKFEHNGHVLLVLESHNHIIAFVRDQQGKRPTEFAEVMERVAGYAEGIFTEGLKPLSAKDLKIFRTSMSPLYVYGWYVPRIEALTGGGKSAEDLLTTGGVVNDTSSAARATAVRFFSNGEFAAFMALKPVAAGELKNPFESRFASLKSRYPGGETPFWENDSLAARARGKKRISEEEEKKLRERQIEEYLGSFLYNPDGRKLSEKVPVKDLERAFLELSREQQLAIVERKMVDEYLASGMRSFTSKDYDGALRAWTRLLQLDPENPRGAILLQMAVKQRALEDYGGNTEKARRNPLVDSAMDAIQRQQTSLALRRDQASLDEARDRAIRNFRTRGLSFLSESNYEDSLAEWEKILKVDPGNPTALLFKDICEDRMRGYEDVLAPGRPGVPVATTRP